MSRGLEMAAADVLTPREARRRAVVQAQAALPTRNEDAEGTEGRERDAKFFSLSESSLQMFVNRSVLQSIVLLSPSCFLFPSQTDIMAPSRKAHASSSSSASSTFRTLLESYKATPARLQLIDAFLLALMVSGIYQFAYCVLVTNFPFNAFLASFVFFCCCPFCCVVAVGPDDWLILPLRGSPEQIREHCRTIRLARFVAQPSQPCKQDRVSKHLSREVSCCAGTGTCNDLS
jgi:hypothetical protein